MARADIADLENPTIEVLFRLERSVFSTEATACQHEPEVCQDQSNTIVSLSILTCNSLQGIKVAPMDVLLIYVAGGLASLLGLDDSAFASMRQGICSHLQSTEDVPEVAFGRLRNTSDTTLI